MNQAVILAAGEGQRLRPFTANKPKVMLVIAGKPILQYVVESLAQNGIRNIVLVVGYRREQIFDCLGSGAQFGVNINYIIQERQLGTAHALAQVKDVTENEFLVISGDNLIEADTIAQFVNTEPESLIVKRTGNPSGYGVVTIENNKVKEIVEKPGVVKSNAVNTGIYAFTRDIFNFIENQLDIPDVLNTMIAKGYPVSVQETNGLWLDVVYPWDILNLNDVILRRIKGNLGGTIESGVSLNGLVSVGRDTLLRSGSYMVGPAVIGNNCDIGPGVCILPATSIGDNVVISPFSTIKNSVIGNDVDIGPGCIIQDSIIDNGCVIKGHFSACSGPADIKINEHRLVNIGAILGEGCNLASNVVAQPGVILGNHCQVQALKVISGRLPDKSLVF
ncbi:MAG: sugar phosphate nucleotidyltransferase [Dehalococcoidales bacterium]|nr:sugar phosphate nucleotidyltransferase [Dehalococcoidales bacterium]